MIGFAQGMSVRNSRGIIPEVLGICRSEGGPLGQRLLQELAGSIAGGRARVPKAGQTLAARRNRFQQLCRRGRRSCRDAAQPLVAGVCSKTF